MDRFSITWPGILSMILLVPTAIFLYQDNLKLVAICGLSALLLLLYGNWKLENAIKKSLKEIMDKHNSGGDK